MKKPNILVIMSDQHSALKSGCYGDPIVRTPNLDRLASEGMLFDAAYCAQPVCVPSRMSFMTGRRSTENLVTCNSHILSSNVPTWPMHLNLVDYETALIGRMHFDGLDQHHGFKYVPDKFKATHDKERFVFSEKVPQWRFWGGRSGVEGSGIGSTYVKYRDELVTEEACAYLEGQNRDQNKPFALVTGFYMPHPPYIADKDLFAYYYDRVTVPNEDKMPDYLQEYMLYCRDWWHPESVSNDRKRVALAAYYALIEQTDRLVGKLLDSLESNGLKENTLVVYCSDHGEMAGKNGAWDKCLFYEDSVRVPMIARWPGKIEANSVSHKVCNLRDLADTFCEVADAERITGTDVRSLWPLMTNSDEPWDNYTDSDFLFTTPILRQNTPATCRMLRRDQWKMWVYEINEVLNFSLYNLNDDPQEQTDLIHNAELSELIARMKTQLLKDWDWRNIRKIGQLGRSDWGWQLNNFQKNNFSPRYEYPKNLDDDVVIEAEKVHRSMNNYSRS